MSDRKGQCSELEWAFHILEFKHSDNGEDSPATAKDFPIENFLLLAWTSVLNPKLVISPPDQKEAVSAAHDDSTVNEIFPSQSQSEVKPKPTTLTGPTGQQQVPISFIRWSG